MFKMTEEDANAAITTQTPTNENNSNSDNGGAPAIPPVVPTATNAEHAELERLRAENAELKQRQLEADRDQRIKAAAASVNIPASLRINGEMAVRRTRAIAEAKGIAYWNKYSVADRVNILTDGGYVPAKDSELARYFGPKAKTSDTTQLLASDLRRYRSYRATAIELGWM